MAQRSANPTSNAWPRIHTWLASNAPKIRSSLNAPAADEHLRAMERSLHFEMSPAWRDLYRVHDGMNSHDNLGSLFYGLEFFSLEKARQEQSLSNIGQADPVPAKPADHGINTRDLYNPKWVPFAGVGRTTLRIDMDPGVGGSAGQVIFVYLDFDTVILIARNLDEFLSGFAADLEAGKYFLNPEAKQEGNEFLDCVPEIDVVNWHKSPRWKYLDK